MNTDIDLKPVDTFLNSALWNEIVDEADYNINARDMMEVVYIQVDSLHFFMQQQNHARVNREYNELIKLINIIQTTI